MIFVALPKQRYSNSIMLSLMFFVQNEIFLDELLSTCTYNLFRKVKTKWSHHSVYEYSAYNFDGSSRNNNIFNYHYELMYFNYYFDKSSFPSTPCLLIPKKKIVSCLLSSLCLRHGMCHFSKEPPKFFVSRYNIL